MGMETKELIFELYETIEEEIVEGRRSSGGMWGSGEMFRAAIVGFGLMVEDECMAPRYRSKQVTSHTCLWLRMRVADAR